MAAYVSTIINAPAMSTTPAPILWASFATGANNVAFNVKMKDASKMVILVAGMSTLTNYIWVGTSDSRSSHTSMHYPYSGHGVGRMKIKTTIAADGKKQSRFLSTVAADTEVYGIYAIGPFETARFKDSDGYINVCRGVTTAGAASGSSDTFYIAAIMIP